MWRRFLRIGRAAVLVCAIGLALLGALVAPAVALVWAPVIGLIGVLVVALVGPTCTGQPVARRTVALAGVTGALLVPWTTGLGALGNAGAFVVIATLVVASLWAVELVAESPETSEGMAARRELMAFRRVAAELPVGSLLQEWRRTEPLARDDVHPEVRSAGADIRALVVDELARRDPAGLEHWLRHGEGDPGRYVPGGVPGDIPG